MVKTHKGARHLKWMFLCIVSILGTNGLCAQDAVPTTSMSEIVKRLEVLEKKLNEFQEKSHLSCEGGEAVKGPMDAWSPYSKCPKAFQATGLQRIDIIGDHLNPTNHVNDFQCNEQGCKAWCIGGPCTVQARCCR